MYLSWDNTYDWKKCSYLRDGRNSNFQCGSRRYSFNRNRYINIIDHDGGSTLGVYSSDPRIGELTFIRSDVISDQTTDECKESGGDIYCMKGREFVSAWKNKKGYVDNILYKKTIEQHIRECRKAVL